MTDNLPSPIFGGKVNIKDMQSLAAKAQQAAQNNPRGGAPGNSDYMNFSGKSGIYSIGADNREIPSDELWVIDITSFEEGWVCWKGGQPAATRLSNIYNDVPVAQPDFNEFGPFDKQGDGWYQAKAMVMKSVDHDQQGYFKINSVSGVSSMAELIGEFAQRAGAGLACWPVVRCTKEKFTSKGYTNFKPVFAIEAWLSTEQVQALAEGADIEDLMEQAEGQQALPAPVDEAPEEPPAKTATGRRRSNRG